jgi:hypothetical protein
MKKIVLIFIFSIILFSCKKDQEVPKPAQPFTKSKISGLSQKGPFINGSSLTVFELNENFSQTGKSFNTQILDNMGSFELNDLTLLTQYAKLKADGFYFNEITNSNSTSPISLYALSDLSDKSTVNINLLSTLEVTRIQYLISSGLSFSNAKHQAQQEILKIFFINKPDISESERLDISVNTEDNAILLATSLILQGYRTEAELSQLIGDIATDIRIDGILNSPTLGSLLLNDATLFNFTQIRSNIENKYVSFGVPAVIPDFEHYINQFKNSAIYTLTNQITYPASGVYGINVLNTADTLFASGTYYSFTADLPSGTSLKVCAQDAVGSNGGLGYDLTSLNGWFSWAPAVTGDCWTMESSRTGLINLRLMAAAGDVTINFYENGSLTPTRVKIIHIL